MQFHTLLIPVMYVVVLSWFYSHSNISLAQQPFIYCSAVSVPWSKIFPDIVDRQKEIQIENYACILAVPTYKKSLYNLIQIYSIGINCI